VRRVTVVLNDAQADLVDQLVLLGIYGRDVEDVVLRALDRRLLALVEAPRVVAQASHRPERKKR
jgi:hypothetical protein